MPRRRVWLAVTGAVLIWAGAAAARTANPPAGAFTGDYKVTVQVTNAKAAPSHWIYGARPRCAGPCHAVTFRDRLVSEKSWRSASPTFRWNGKAYAYSKTFPKYADCRARSGATVTKGYDVTSSEKFEIRAVTNGRVTRWSGTDRDSYVPNAAGRAHHCSAGVYLYSLKAVAQ
jgi:hypothetical protein